MKSEKFLEQICVLIREHDMSDAGTKTAEQAIAHPETFPGAWPFYGAACALLIEARAELDAQTTPVKVSAAIRRMLRDKNMHNVRLPGLFEHGGKWIYCDGARMLRLNADITSVPHCENKIEFNPDSVMNGVKMFGEMLNLPKISTLKAYIASEKARVGARKYKRFRDPYYLGGVTYVDPQRLIDMLEALPGCTAVKPDGRFSPVYFSAKNGDGILLPCRPPRKETE